MVGRLLDKIKTLFKKEEKCEIDLSPYFTWDESALNIFRTYAYDYEQEYEDVDSCHTEMINTINEEFNKEKQ